MQEQEFSFKSLFIPITTFKAIQIIIIVGIIVFFNMLFNGFALDDLPYIVGNQDFHQLSNILDFFRTNIFNLEGQYRPIPAMYFYLLYNIFSNSTFFYHIIQLAIHIGNTFILFQIFKHFVGKRITLFLCLLFLVHPIQVESVSYISASDNPLFFLFGISAFYLSLETRVGWKRLIAIFFLLMLSLLTKETGILFILAVLAYRFIFKKGQIITFIIYSSIVTLLYFFIRIELSGNYITPYGSSIITQITFAERINNIPSIIFFYLKTFFFPRQLIIEQLWVVTKLNVRDFYVPLFIDFLFFLMLALVCIYIYAQNKKNFKTYLFFSLWFMIGLLFHSQIFPLDWTVADRWFYFTFVGLLGVIGILAETFKIKSNHTKMLAYILVVMLLIILSWRTIIRNTNWHDNLTLMIHDSNIMTNSNLENSIGLSYESQQMYDNAIVHFKKSITISPSIANLSNLANAYALSGDGELAKKYYFLALQIGNYSQNSTVYLSIDERLGQLLVRTDKPEIAKKFIINALKYFPNSSRLWYQLALIEEKLHNHNDAIIDLEKANKLLPSE